MSIIKILIKTIVRIVWCVIAILGVITEGLTKIFKTLYGYFDKIDNKIDGMFKKKEKKEKNSIDVPA